MGPDLLLFLSENVSAPGGLGFQATGWAAAIIGNPDADPSAWNVNVLPTRSDFGLAAGASVLQWQGYLYAYATPIAQPATVYLVRWPLATVVSGRLAGDQWYTAHGWGPAGTAPVILMRDGQAEFSVFPGLSLAPFVLFQTVGFGPATIAYRTANDPTGDWSDATAFYSPPESTRPGILIYSAKTHPMLVNPGAEFVLSYSTNSTDFQTLLTDESLYFPRFLQVTQG